MHIGKNSAYCVPNTVSIYELMKTLVITFINKTIKKAYSNNIQNINIHLLKIKSLV